MFTALASNQEADAIDITVSKVTDSSATLSWRAGKNYECYEVLKYNSSTSEYGLVTTTSKTSFKIKKLNPAGSYRYMVRAKNNNMVFGIATFKTKQLTPKITVEDISSDSVELNISGVSKKDTIAIYRGKSKASMKKIATLKDKGSYTDNKVKSKKKYYYMVEAKHTDITGATTTKKSKIVSLSTPKSMGLPSVSGKTKTYAYYTAVTVKSSPQYKLLNSKECYTDEETGIKMVDGCYCIALGSYYGSKIGTKYKITLSSGESFMAILCDQKANRHTDSKHQYAVRNKDIVEFYVQKSKIPKSVNGNYGRLEQFKGSIVSIEKF